MFGAQTAANDRIKSDEEWMDDLLPRNNKFTVLSWVDSDLIALSAAREKKEKGFWHVGSDYVKPEFRGGGVGKKMLAFRLEEIIKRGGLKVEAGIDSTNQISMGLYESFGFKRANIIDDWQMMEADLTDSEVIRKVNEVFNAG